jgi:hypothetical protein
VIVIYTPHEATHPTYVSQAAVRRLGDRLFIAGKYPRFPGHEFAWDLPVWSPLSEVTQIMEFDNLEHAIKSIQAREQSPSPSFDPTREPS